MYASFVRTTCSGGRDRHFRVTSMLGRWTPHSAKEQPGHVPNLSRSQPIESSARPGDGGWRQEG